MARSIETASAGKVLAASVIGLAFGLSAIGVASFGVFVVPLSQAFGWGRGDISIALSVMSLTVIVAVPTVGVLIDRVGVRRVLIPSTLLFGLTLASMSLLTANLWHLYVCYFVLAIVGVGTAPASYSKIILAWFDERRGLALGVALAGIGIGTALVPPFLQAVASRSSWRAGYLGLGLLVIGIALPVITAWVRDRPVVAGDERLQARLRGFDFRAALRRRSFALLAAGFILLGLVTGGILAHLVPLMRDRGVTPEAAAGVASILGIALIFGRLLTGYLLDRIFAPIVVATLLLAPTLGLALLVAGASSQLAVGAAVLIGIGLGAEMDFMSYLIARYLGMAAFGRLYGLTYAIFTVGISIGPLLMGYSQQTTGSYDFALRVLLGAAIAAVPAFAFLGGYPELPSARPEVEPSSLTSTAAHEARPT